MKLDQAIRKRLSELIKQKNTTLTALCLNSNLTPSTVFDFMNDKTKYPQIITLTKLCCGLEITLSEFFNCKYFNDIKDEVYQ